MIGIGNFIFSSASLPKKKNKKHSIRVSEKVQ